MRFEDRIQAAIDVSAITMEEFEVTVRSTEITALELARRPLTTCGELVCMKMMLDASP